MLTHKSHISQGSRSHLQVISQVSKSYPNWLESHQSNLQKTSTYTRVTSIKSMLTSSQWVSKGCHHVRKRLFFIRVIKSLWPPRPLFAPFLYKFVPLSVVFRAVFSGSRRFSVVFRAVFRQPTEQIKGGTNFFITRFDPPLPVYNRYKKTNVFSRYGIPNF